MKHFTVPSHLFARILVYTTGLVLLMFGTALSIRSNLGTTCSASLGQNLSLLTGISLGTVLLFINLVFVAVQLILTKRRNYIQILLQIPINFLSSWLIDQCMLWANTWNMDSLLLRFLLLLVSFPFIALGAVGTIVPNFAPTTPDGIVQTISDRFGWKLANVKNIFDICQVAAASVLFLSLRGSLGSVHVGTILSALLIGRFVGIFMKYLAPLLPFHSSPENQV